MMENSFVFINDLKIIANPKGDIFRALRSKILLSRGSEKLIFRALIMKQSRAGKAYYNDNEFDCSSW